MVSQGVIALAKNAGYNSRTKHIDIKHHFTRENMENGKVQVDYVDTKNQLTDLLTKTFRTKTLKFQCKKSGIKTKVAMH